jgi:hypothetical protein
MKRFLLFVGETYYPLGGAFDLMGSFDSLAEVIDLLFSDHTFGIVVDWIHVLDTEDNIIYKCENNFLGGEKVIVWSRFPANLQLKSQYC